MKLQRVWLFGIAGGLLAGVLGCSSTKSTLPVYDSRQTNTPISIQKGRIVAVQDVLIKGGTIVGRGGIGPGATIGAGVVTSVLTGSSRAIGNAVGNVVGGSIGAQADNKIGEEITIEMEGGRTIIVVQERSDPPLAPDERVLIQTGGSTGSIIYGGGMGNTRVVRDTRFADNVELRR